MDKITPQQRSENMRRIRSKHSKPEAEVRSLVHRLGYRYRLHVSTLPGTPDLVFRRRHKIIFVHGCFWHQHNNPKCKVACKPKSNISYWHPKLEANTNRDKRQQELLIAQGWKLLIIWECEIPQPDLRHRIIRFLEERKTESYNANSVSGVSLSAQRSRWRPIIASM